MRCDPHFRRLRIAAVLALVLTGTAPATAVEKPAHELRGHSQNLAFYLRLLPEYIQWPSDTFTDDKQPFVLGILGDDPFSDDADIAAGVIKIGPEETAMGAILKYLYPTTGARVRVKGGDGKPLITRNLVINRFPKVKEGIASCHLLFVSAAMEKRLPEVLKLIDRSSVLTISSDVPDFTRGEGMINCVAKKNVNGTETIKLEINFKATEKSNFKLDQGLFSLLVR